MHACALALQAWLLLRAMHITGGCHPPAVRTHRVAAACSARAAGGRALAPARPGRGEALQRRSAVQTGCEARTVRARRRTGACLLRVRAQTPKRGPRRAGQRLCRAGRVDEGAEPARERRELRRRGRHAARRAPGRGAGAGAARLRAPGGRGRSAVQRRRVGRRAALAPARVGSESGTLVLRPEAVDLLAPAICTGGLGGPRARAGPLE